MFIAEPDPSESTEVIDKVFTLIIDRSGSMSGDKIVQARNAAKFIINNLNPGDKFNIVDFSEGIKSFRGEHVEFNASNETAALNYISTLVDGGSTNISGAFGKAVPQFSAASANTANIIIFFTDGEQTAGITNTDDLINYIDNLVVQSETNVIIFTFGIGSSTNTRLLNTIAANNSGLAEFLGNSELESRITEFYLMIRNPVLLKTEFETTPEGFLKEVYPVKLPNLYKGQQMILTGRYQEKADMDIVFNGEAFGELVSYNYSPELSDSTVQKLSFIPKVWAKQKIEYLLTEYYQLSSTSALALEIKEQIIDLSLDYRVISPFTSFQGVKVVEDPGDIGGYVSNELEFDAQPTSENVLIANLGNYPNPFTYETVFRFEVLQDIQDLAILRIYNSAGMLIKEFKILVGMLIKEFKILVRGQDIYEVRWMAGHENSDLVPGLYTYSLSVANEIAVGRLIYKGR